MLVNVVAGLIGVALALVAARIALEPSVDRVLRGAAACSAVGVVLLTGALFLLPAPESPPILLVAGIALVTTSVLLGVFHLATAGRTRTTGGSAR